MTFAKEADFEEALINILSKKAGKRRIKIPY